MLVLTRKNGQSVHVGADIAIHVLEVRQGFVRLGIEAPSSTRILRSELIQETEDENKRANHEMTVEIVEMPAIVPTPVENKRPQRDS